MTIQIGGGSGAAGSGGGLGLDLWASQANPDGVTDWGPIINTALTAGIRRFAFKDHVYPFSTTINCHNLYAVLFEGARARGWSTPAAYTNSWNHSTRLMWKGGAGSGPAIDCTGSDGVEFRDLGILYDSATFDGELIDMRGTGSFSPTWASKGKLSNCQVGGIDSTHMSARSLVNWDGHVNGEVSGCTMSFAKACIRGQYTSNTDDCRIYNNMFYCASQAHIMNPGRYWRFKDNVTIGTLVYGLPATPFVCSSEDAAGPGSGMSGQRSIFSWEGNNHWDRSTGEGVFNQIASCPWDIVVGGQTMFWLDGETEFKLNGPGTVTIRDCWSNRATGPALVDLGSSSTALKTKVLIENNSWYTATGAVVNWQGHNNVTIRRNINSAGSSNVDEVITVQPGHEMIAGTGQAVPTIALAAGQPATGAQIYIFGNDNVGVVALSPGASGFTAGELLDVTFHTVWPSDPLVGAGYGSGQACVILTPASPSGWAGGTAAAKAAAYVIPVGNTGWNLGVANAVPTGTQLAWNYRIVKL